MFKLKVNWKSLKMAYQVKGKEWLKNMDLR